MSENKWRVIKDETLGSWARFENELFCLSIFEGRAIFNANPVTVNMIRTESMSTFRELRESIIRLSGHELPSDYEFQKLLDDGIAALDTARGAT